MNKNRMLVTLAVCAAIALWLAGCASASPPVKPSTTPQTSAPQQQNLKSTYYGVNLEEFPPNVREWIVNTGFPKQKMEGPAMTNPTLRAWWSEDNNAVLFEAAYIVANGYEGAGNRKVWGQGAAYRGSGNIYDMYGEYAKYHTLRYNWELKQEVERLLREDSAYAEVIAFAKQLCSEIEYDWASFSGYTGSKVIPTPGLRRHVCDGYANEVMDKVLALKSVRAVQKWSSPGHAWNVLQLVDGRTLYFDLTWFDNEHINHETGRVYQTDDYRWENITFDRELFYHSNVGYGTRVFHHKAGTMGREVRK
jgi:hypothetical protein